MIRCSRCGKQNDDDYIYCAYCGTQLPSAKSNSKILLDRNSTSENILIFMKTELQKGYLEIYKGREQISELIEESSNRINIVTPTEDGLRIWDSFIKLQKSVNSIERVNELSNVFLMVVIKTLQHDVSMIQFRQAVNNLVNEFLPQLKSLAESSTKSCLSAISMVEFSIINLFMQFEEDEEE